MTSGVIQGTFLGGRPKLAMPAPQPAAMPGPPLPAHVVQPRMTQAAGVPMPKALPPAMPRPPGPPAPAHVVQPRAPQAQPRSAQPHAAGGAVAVDPALLRAAGRPGQPLPDAVQRKMEQAFGADFSSVRVHEGPQAESIGAIAFTVGTDIYFAPGRFQPHTAAGQQLLGHELTHVLQQRAGRVRNPLGSSLAVVQDRALEAEADRMGHRAAAQMMPAAAAARQAKAAQTQPHGHKLVVGTYMHRGPGATGLPAEAAGHTFVAVQAPGGRREAYGFSPANPQGYDFRRDISTLRTGVPGAVQREDGAFAKPGVRTRTYDVSPEQARAALAKVAEYKSHSPAFSFARRDCGQFANDVLKAARIEGFGGPGVKRPAELYRQVQAPVAGDAQTKAAGIPAPGQRPVTPHVQAAVAAVQDPVIKADAHRMAQHAAVSLPKNNDLFRSPAPQPCLPGSVRGPLSLQRSGGCTDRYCKIRHCPGNHPPTQPPRYRQELDPSIKPYLKRKEKRMGDPAFAKQIAGQAPTAEDVRLVAVQDPDTRTSSGMHEWFPTNKAPSLVGDGEGAAFQSGCRTSTNQTYLLTPSGEIAAHTNACPKSVGSGSTHTRGQSKAHDVMRNFRPQGKTKEERGAERHKHVLSMIPNGQQIVASSSLTGAIPNRIGSAPIEPVGGPAPARIRLAQDQHQRREKMKQRADTLAISRGVARPSTPPRADIDDSGGGGGYTYGVQGPPSPLPNFDESNPDAREADMHAWFSAPLRNRPDYQTQVECKSCSWLNPNKADTCSRCRKNL